MEMGLARHGVLVGNLPHDDDVLADNGIATFKSRPRQNLIRTWTEST